MSASLRAVKGTVISSVLLAALAPSPASADGGPFGLGIILGDPSGLSAKLFVDERHAFDAALDFSFRDDSTYVHVDYLFHFKPLTTRNGPESLFLPYAGFGGKFRVHDGHRHDDHDTSVGLRIPLGIAWIPRKVPIDVFAEIVPGLVVLPGTDPAIDAGIGIRYYF